MTVRTRYAAVTLTLVLAGAAYVLGQAWLERPAPPRPSRAAAVRPTPLPPPPTARDLIARAAGLGLTAEQTARLAALDQARGQESAERDRALAAARAGFERFAREAGARGASAEEIQRQSAEYRELSAALREARRRHADAARAILSETQRRSLARGPSASGQGGTR